MESYGVRITIPEDKLHERVFANVPEYRTGKLNSLNKNKTEGEVIWDDGGTKTWVTAEDLHFLDDASAIGTEKVESMRSDLDEALKSLTKKHNLNFQAGTFVYDGVNLTMRVICSVVGKDGHIETVEAKEFKKLAHQHGFKPLDLGKQFIYGNRKFKLVGLDVSNKKCPIIAKRIKNNKKWNFPAWIVKSSWIKE